MSEQAAFLERSAAKAGDEIHRLKILKAIRSYEGAVDGMKSRQFRDWQEARLVAEAVKDYTLEHLPDLLEEFERNLCARGGQVLWAEDAEDARGLFLGILRRHGARKVVKSKSMTTEEVELNALLEQNGVEVLESDLGELIVQLAGEKPYHIVTPAMHKSKDDIALLFHEKLGTPLEASAEELTMTARAHLRDAYVTADVGVTGANFLVAQDGAVVMVENEGNGRLCMACPPVHVVIVGLEKLLPRLTDLSLFLPLLATSGTGQQVTCYNSIVRGPRGPDEVDGPEHLYVILLDNGRSRLFADETFREALRCIRCGACLNACPVYRTVGGHTYNTTYQGPIGSVITPHLREMAGWNHLSFASSLCGACTDVCPVRIDLHHLLLENRWRADLARRSSRLWKWAMRGWAGVMSTRRRLDRAAWWMRRFEGLIHLLLPRRKRRRVPRLAEKSFAELWEERHGKS